MMTNTSRKPASPRLMLDNHLIPVPKPDATEAVAMTVMPAMRPTCNHGELVPQFKNSIPAPS